MEEHFVVEFGVWFCGFGGFGVFFFVVSDRILSLYFFQSEILIVKVLSVYTALR